MALALARLGVVLLPLMLSGCVGYELKLLQIQDLKNQSAVISDDTAYLAPAPKLGANYGAHIVIGETAFNNFLAGLDNYSMPMPWPAGATLEFVQTRLAFDDGPPHALIVAKAVDRAAQVEITLKIFADLLISADTTAGTMVVKFAVTEIMPDIQFSIFRWHEFWLGMAVLSIEAQKYVDTLPATTIPLATDLPINVDPPSTGTIALPNNSWVNVNQSMPRFDLDYTYTVQRVLTLKDGIHVFFALQKRG